jgi:hypothetical protein
MDVVQRQDVHAREPKSTQGSVERPLTLALCPAPASALDVDAPTPARDTTPGTLTGMAPRLARGPLPGCDRAGRRGGPMDRPRGRRARAQPGADGDRRRLGRRQHDCRDRAHGAGSSTTPVSRSERRHARAQGSDHGRCARRVRSCGRLSTPQAVARPRPRRAPGRRRPPATASRRPAGRCGCRRPSCRTVTPISSFAHQSSASLSQASSGPVTIAFISFIVQLPAAGWRTTCRSRSPRCGLRRPASARRP